MTYEQALNKAAALCSSREYCAAQIEDKLRRWEVADEEQPRIIARLMDEKYIDNLRFARAFCADKLRYNRWGRLKIRQALRLLRLSDEEIRHGLESIDDEEYLAILDKVLDAKARTLRKTDPYLRSQKLIRYALSHGFETALVLDLLRE